MAGRPEPSISSARWAGPAPDSARWRPRIGANHWTLAHLLRQVGAYPLCTQWDWRGDAALPFEPPASRAAAEAPDGRGRSPRTPAPVRARRSGAPLWSLPTTQAEQVAFDQAAEALRLPNAGERASEAVSAVRELSPDPPASPSRTAPPTEAPPTSAGTRRRRGRTPSRRDGCAAGAGWERPRTTNRPANEAPAFGAVDPWIGRGSLPAPPYAPGRSPAVREPADEPQRCQRLS